MRALLVISLALIVAGIAMSATSSYKRYEVVRVSTMSIAVGGRSEATASYTPSSMASLVKLQYIGGCGTTVKAEYMGTQVKGGLDCMSSTIYLRPAELQNAGEITLTVDNYAENGTTAGVKITEYSTDLPYSILSIPAYLLWLIGLMFLLVQVFVKLRLKTSPASES